MNNIHEVKYVAGRNGGQGLKLFVCKPSKSPSMLHLVGGRGWSAKLFSPVWDLARDKGPWSYIQEEKWHPVDSSRMKSSNFSTVG